MQANESELLIFLLHLVQLDKFLLKYIYCASICILLYSGSIWKNIAFSRLYLFQVQQILTNVQNLDSFCFSFCFAIILLNPFLSIASFLAPRKHQKNFGFLMFSGGSKKNITKKLVKLICKHDLKVLMWVTEVHI